MTIWDIAREVPLWVGPLFIVLVLLGLRASRDRRSPLILVYALPLLGLLSIRTLSVFDGLLVWPIFAVCVGIGAWLGWQAQPRWLISKKGRSADLRGEWVTLLSIMTVFLVNFGTRLTVQIAPDALGAPAIQALLPVLPGLVTGLFLGRALFLWRAPG